MSTIYIVLVYLSLNLVPPGTDFFFLEIQRPYTKPEKLSFNLKDAENIWEMRKEKNDMTLSLFQLDNNSFKIKSSQGMLEYPIGQMINIKEIDWNSIGKIEILHKPLGSPLKIDRQDNQIIFSQKQGQIASQKVFLQWE